LSPITNSRIYLRLNDQPKEINLTNSDQSCPKFESGVKQSFEFNVTQNEQPKKLTIGYVNSSNSATKWKLEKVRLSFLK
jgi:hypothetical protein